MELFYVEDNPADVKLLKAAFRLTKFEPRMTIAEDGLQAVGMIKGRFEDRKPLPNLILVDLNLPKMNGYDVLKYLKENPEFKSLPVIIFTGSSNPDDRSRSLSMQADDYWAKPYDLEQAIEIAKKLKSLIAG